jgi:tetratricopeptide (TPR) repeat protein
VIFRRDKVFIYHGDTLRERLLQSGFAVMFQPLRARSRLGLATLAVLGFALCPRVGSSATEMHSHPAPERLGTVTFATSCSDSVSHNFERAVALLHSFAYDAAEKAFREVATTDPTCAMAQWGLAMVNWHQLWSPPDAEDLSTGREAIARAQQLNVKSERERQFIAAAAAFFKDSDHSPHLVRAKAYEEAMHQAARSNPKDTETQVFYALALVATAVPEDRTHANQKLAASILEPIYQAHPDHPGVAHYLIHAYDSTELAPQGVAAARAYSKIAPSAPHALHMPSHIFTRLGLWDDSIASNSAARAAARSQGDVGEELHAMDYLTYAYLQRGRQADAQQVVASLKSMGALLGKDFKVGYAATAMPIRLAMEDHKWEAAAGLQTLPESPPNIATLVYWARAEAKARSGHPKDADDDIAELRKCQQRLQAAGSAYWARQTEILTQEAVAWQLAATSHTDEAVKTLRQAADAEDSVEKLPLTPGPIVPAREQLGDLLLTLKQPEEALKEYQATLVSAPGRRGALTGAVQSADMIGDVQLASRFRQMLLKD